MKTTYKVGSCGDCPLAQDHMYESYCGPLMATTTDDAVFTIKDPSEPPPENCPLREQEITVRLKKAVL